MLDELTFEEQQELLQHRTQFHSGKAVLLYYSWEDFDAVWFTGNTEIENKALLVESQCSKHFIDVCRDYSAQIAKDTNDEFNVANFDDRYDEVISKTGIIAGAAIESSQTAIFAEQKTHINTTSGHGEMAEEANNLLDRLNGLDAKVIGRDNTKDGDDRQIGDILIQTKYYNSARGSLEACFNPETGLYRYMSDGKPMQLEVPKDQYQKVLEGFKTKSKMEKCLALPIQMKLPILFEKDG